MIKENVKSHFQTALESAQLSANEALRKKAIESGWPVHLSTSLQLDTSGEVTYPEEYKKEIENLEYGTTENPPISVIRLFKEESHYQEHLENMMIESLFETGVL